jgi:hypothetical protein
MLAVRELLGHTTEYWYARKETFYGCVEIISKKRQVDIILLDMFVPISYLAVDYKEITDVSYMLARHYLLKDEGYPTDMRGTPWDDEPSTKEVSSIFAYQNKGNRFNNADYVCCDRYE